MTDLQSLAAYPVGSAPAGGIEEVTVKGKKPEEEGFTFWDFLDVINPLQHIPVVNTIYREMTGDEIKPPAKMIGSAIIGGPIGLAVAMADSIVEDTTGKDMGGHAMAMFRGDEDNNTASSQLASGTAATAAVTATAANALTGSAREFVPAAVTAMSAASLPAQAFFEDDEAEENTRSDERTEATIAAASAAAPPGLVFMPLPGRQQSGGARLPVGESRAQEFMPLKQTDRASAQRSARVPAANQAAVSQIQAAFAGAGSAGANPIGGMGNSRSLDPLLESTKPQGDTGIMPALDPFAAARRVSDESGAVAMPAWFDRTMIDAVEKYKALQNTGRAG